MSDSYAKKSEHAVDEAQAQAQGQRIEGLGDEKKKRKHRDKDKEKDLKRQGSMKRGKTREKQQ